MDKTTKRRDRGSGSVTRRKDGRWEAKFYPTVGPRASVYGKTRAEVQRRLLAAMLHPRPYDPEHLTLVAWLTRWLETVKAERAAGTYRLYRHAVAMHVVPHVGSVRLADVTKARVYGLLDELVRRGIGARMRQTVHKALHRALEVAFRRELVARNVVSLVDRPIARSKEKRVVQTTDELRRFYEAARASRYRALYVMLIDTGLRLGEACALQWRDVDLNAGRLHVHATLVTNVDGKLVATQPKTKSSNRTILLPKSTVEILRSHRKGQMKADGSSWVFPRADGKPLHRDGFARAELRRVARRAGIPGLTFHSLRHSHATLCAALGVPLKVAQERLGHASSRLTADLYQHGSETIQEGAVSAFDAVHATLDDADEFGRQNSRQPTTTVGAVGN